MFARFDQAERLGVAVDHLTDSTRSVGFLSGTGAV